MIIVSVIILKNNEILMVQEGKRVWNIPSERLKNADKTIEADKIKVLKETGYEIEAKGMTGIYNFISETNARLINQI